MTISDTLIILATLLSPLIAIQVQKTIELATERRSAKRKIFHDLMATRATPVAPTHVQALNMIDLEFSPSRWRRQTAREREVLKTWRIYADHLNEAVDNNNEAAVTAWLLRKTELFIDLLVALAHATDYSFDRVQLKRGVYYPRAHGEAERRRDVFEEAIMRVVTGGQPLSMKVTELPYSSEALDTQIRAHEAFLSAVDEKGAIRVQRATG